MAKLVFGMNVSLDGYVDHDAFGPDATLFRHFVALVRGLTESERIVESAIRLTYVPE